jgi:hypothetical protein
MIMKREKGIDQFMMQIVNKKGKVKDIRDEVSLGYMDLQKRNNSSLLVGIEKPKTSKCLSFSHTNSTGDFTGRQ